MKIALCSSWIPFVQGGYRNIVEWLEKTLRDQGHQVEIVYLPQIDCPDYIIQQMMAYRWIDLDSADRVICFRPHAHLIQHKNKVVWFIHHMRSFYDLWDSPYRGFPDDQKHRSIKNKIKKADCAALSESKLIFANSKVVFDRLLHFNNIKSEILYPPIYDSDRFFCSDFNDEILSVCRVENHKRQHLLIEALALTKSPIRLRLCGESKDSGYANLLKKRIHDLNLTHRVIFENCWIDEDQKVLLLASCLASAYIPFDEDSYGYPTLEAAHSSKPTLTTVDAGGVLEFVINGINGVITNPTPAALATAMDLLFENRSSTIEMGKNANARIKQMNISWEHVVKRLLS